MEKYLTSELWFYPIKSCKGISIQNAIIEERGIKLDRRWMVVDSFGRFLTQRSHPNLALVKVELAENRLVLNAPQMPAISFATDEYEAGNKIVTIWNEKCAAHSVNQNVNKWFSNYLNENVSLVFFPDYSVRPIDPAFAVGAHTTSFTDGFPFLLISQSSLNDLNDKLKNKVLMNRFRPNIVVSGTAAFEEDLWKVIKIGDVQMSIVKPCSRCSITTTNQETAKRGKEPLMTLAKYRVVNGKVMFGQNVIHQNRGHLKVGDKVYVLEKKGPS